MFENPVKDKTQARGNIISNVAVIASEEYMDCYGLHGGRYFNAVEAIGYYGLNDILLRNLFEFEVVSKKEYLEILEFSKFLKETEKNIDFMNPEDTEVWLVTNKDWLELQEKARELLVKLGVDLKKWEDENIHWSAVGVERPEKYRNKQ